MTKMPGDNHPAVFKAREVLEAIRGEKTVAELAAPRGASDTMHVNPAKLFMSMAGDIRFAIGGRV